MTRRFKELKSEGGAEGRAEGRAEGITEGKTEERIKAIQKMLHKGFDKQTILSLDYTEEEYQEAEASMLAPV